MESTRFIGLTVGHTGAPEHIVSPDDELRALLEAQTLVKKLARRVAAHTSSPVRAALFAQVAEDAHRTAAHTQLLAAETTRRTLAHELPESTFNAIAVIHADPAPYIQGTIALPADPATIPTGRLVFRNTTELLTGLLHIGFFEARERVRAIDRLLPGTDNNGNPTPARFPLLAKDLADGAADPTQIGTAARKLEKLAPHLKQHPNQTQLSGELEEQIAESVRHDDPRITAKLLTTIQNTLEKDSKELPEEILRANAGLFYRGVTGGLGEFLLRTFPGDTEALLALCASTDNPRTHAGDRNGLLAQTLNTPSNNTGVGDDAAPATNGSNDRPDSTDSVSGSRFPDFLVDPATRQPLTDLASINSLSMDPVDLGTVFNGNRTTGNENGGNDTRNDPESMNSTVYGPDGLTPPQRHLQGLMNLIKSAGKPSTGKKTIGIPSPKSFIIATLAEMQGLADTHGITSHGHQLTPSELRAALCNGGVLPMILNGKSRILDLGQEERYFPDYMREAILALYGGCIVPGCTVPPDHCEIHHFDYFANGGKTAIDLGVPGCTDAHHGFHTGLLKVVRDSDGLFSVILPEFMDTEQKPRRNTYWRSASLSPPLF